MVPDLWSVSTSQERHGTETRWAWLLCPMPAQSWCPCTLLQRTQVLVSSKQRNWHSTEGWAVLSRPLSCQPSCNPNRLKLNGSEKAATGVTQLSSAPSDPCLFPLCYWTSQHDGFPIGYLENHKKGTWWATILFKILRPWQHRVWLALGPDKSWCNTKCQVL